MTLVGMLEARAIAGGRVVAVAGVELHLADARHDEEVQQVEPPVPERCVCEKPMMEVSDTW